MSLDQNSAPNSTADLSLQSGIGGYSTISNLDLMFALDFKSLGKLDHIVVYRPGSGICWILENQNPPSQTAVYQPVYQEGDPATGTMGVGIGGYDLKVPSDRVFAFDYEGSGLLDDLVLYRPGNGVFWILQNSIKSPGTFSIAYSSQTGIGNYNLTSTADRVFAFDLEGSGKLDDLVLYRPGTGIISILQNSATTPGDFSVAFASEQGIGGYDLLSTADRAFAFDYEGSGKADDLALYRPGTGTFWIIQNQHTNPATFQLPYPKPPTQGIGGFDLALPGDQAFAFDYESNGNLDDLVLFRPGVGTIYVLQNNHAASPNPPSFTAAFQENGNPPFSVGIAGYDLFATVDQGFAFDFSGVGHFDYLMFYRPGTGAMAILENNRTTPGSFNPAPYQTGLSSVAQVQQNLNNMKALNDALSSYAQTETFRAYLLVTGNQDNNSPLALNVGLQVLAGVFWAAAGAVGLAEVAEGLEVITAASAGFLASFAPGMIGVWIGQGFGPGNVDVNASVAGLVQSFVSAQGLLDKALGDLANDVAGSWTNAYTFDSQTSAISDLANLAFPTEGPAYDALWQAMSSSYLLQIWQTILRADYKVTQFAGCTVAPQPDSSFYASYYQQNPAYFLSYANGSMSFFNLGTGVGWEYPISDGALSHDACGFLFVQFDRETVFLDWGIPTAGTGAHPPDPHPSGSTFPPG